METRHPPPPPHHGIPTWHFVILKTQKRRKDLYVVIKRESTVLGDLNVVKCLVGSREKKPRATDSLNLAGLPARSSIWLNGWMFRLQPGSHPRGGQVRNPGFKELLRRVRNNFDSGEMAKEGEGKIVRPSEIFPGNRDQSRVFSKVFPSSISHESKNLEQNQQDTQLSSPIADLKS